MQANNSSASLKGSNRRASCCATTTTNTNTNTNTNTATKAKSRISPIRGESEQQQQQFGGDESVIEQSAKWDRNLRQQSVGRQPVQRPLIASTRIYGTECDKSGYDGIETDKKTEQIAGNEELAASKKVTEKKSNKALEEEDNLVIPAWPSKSDPIDRSAADFVQHKVYSLKDYSQVASPTEPRVSSSKASTTSLLGTSSNQPASKLLKSMSQDRKIKTNVKRMSECIYLSGPHSVATAATSTPSSKQQNPSASSSQTTTSKAKNSFGSLGIVSVGGASGLFSGPVAATSATLSQPTNSRHAALMSESRIDRMRKLFVSPLSLRSSSTNKAPVSQTTQSQNPRLSFQSGASVLHKPHHLMHAVYKSGQTSHHNRLSPMRQKQGKSFRVYGCPLQLANNIYPITCFGRSDIYKQQSVPYILARLCNYIEENSSQLTHEGIFRVSGNARLMEKLRTLFDHLGDAPLESESVDVATSASMLKMYLRELPEPLIPTRMNYYFITLAKKYAPYLSRESSNIAASFSSISTKKISAASSSTSVTDVENVASNERQRLAFSRDLTKLVRKLPIENYNLLKYLACFLYRISLKQQYNKMCAEALGIVFGPNVFRIRSESYKGLKEQELSNQIMASIISNYKNIFDSELTDPLGNLVEAAKEDLLLLNDKQQIEIGGATIVKRLETATKIAICDTTISKQVPGKSPSPVAPVKQTSSKTSEKVALSVSDLHDGHSCCPKHCRAIYSVNEGASSMHLGKHESDDDEEEEEDCDDGESYTPSSGTGSYCSSMDSDTLESLCEDEEDVEHGSKFGRLRGVDDEDDDIDEDDDEDIDDGNLELASGSQISSSECASDTSYTPTSSHSESDYMLDEGRVCRNGDSSSFESTSPTLEPPSRDACVRTKRKQKERRGSREYSCSTCRRRESSTALVANQGNLRIGIVCDSEGQLANSIKISSTEAEDIVSPLAEAEEEASNYEGHIMKPHSVHRASRKKRTSGTTGGSIRGKQHSKNQLGKQVSHLNASDLQDENLAVSDSLLEERSREKSGGTEEQPTQSRKHNFLKRRSSSASSLTRIKHKRDQIAQTVHRRGQEHSYTHRGSRSNRRLHADVSRVGPSGTSQRRSRNKSGHWTTRRNEVTSSAIDRQAVPTKASKRQTAQISAAICSTSRGSVKGNKIRNNSNYFELELETPELNPDPEVALDFFSAQYIEELEYDRYFLLRSFNSDETLLRSLNYCAEFPLESCGNSNKSQRRFSGQDFTEKQPQYSFVRVCRPCDRIFEDSILEDKVELSSGLIRFSPPVGDELQAQCDLDQKLSRNIDASYVSLLDTKIPFRKSELSINDESGQDSVLVQMKATKELIRALRRLLKFCSTNGYSKDLEILVMGFSDETSSTASDECSACYIDHLSARSLARRIEREIEFAGLLASGCYIDQPQSERIDLNKILDVKITLFKQKYNDLKNIRDHFLRNHANQSIAAKYMRAKLTSPIASLTSDVQLARNLNAYGSLDTLRPKISEISSSEAGLENSEPGTSSKSGFHCRRPSMSALIGPDEHPRAPNRELSQSSEAEDIKANKKPASRKTIACKSKCKFGSLCPVEFVYNIEKQLASKRLAGHRVMKLNEMNVDQLQSEKIELQKNLLRYEHWFGRPVTRLEFSLVGHIYERYRAVKSMKLRKQLNNNVTTSELPLSQDVQCSTEK